MVAISFEYTPATGGIPSVGVFNPVIVMVLPVPPWRVQVIPFSIKRPVRCTSPAVVDLIWTLFTFDIFSITNALPLCDILLLNASVKRTPAFAFICVVNVFSFVPQVCNAGGFNNPYGDNAEFVI